MSIHIVLFKANQMALHEQEYCMYRNITILICSWNIDASKPPDLEKYADDAKFLRLWFTSASSPEIIVIGFQEIIDLESKKMTASEWMRTLFPIFIIDENYSNLCLYCRDDAYVQEKGRQTVEREHYPEIPSLAR